LAQEAVAEQREAVWQAVHDAGFHIVHGDFAHFHVVQGDAVAACHAAGGGDGALAGLGEIDAELSHGIGAERHYGRTGVHQELDGAAVDATWWKCSGPCRFFLLTIHFEQRTGRIGAVEFDAFGRGLSGGHDAR
jgi:hypothetical protein